MKFEIKDKVKLIAPVSYLKTSDNMPMLRPPDLVGIDEIGGFFQPGTRELGVHRQHPMLNLLIIEYNNR